jgi:hypothetical protein
LNLMTKNTYEGALRKNIVTVDIVLDKPVGDG